MGLLTYILVLAFAVAAYVVYPRANTKGLVLLHTIGDAIVHRQALETALDLFPLFDGPAPWPGYLASKGILAHEVERANLPDRVPNIRGPAAYFFVSSTTPYYVMISTGQPQLSYFD